MFDTTKPRLVDSCLQDKDLIKKANIEVNSMDKIKSNKKDQMDQILLENDV